MLTKHAVKWLALALLAAGLVSLGAARPSSATVPGTNGKIAFERPDGAGGIELATIDPSGAAPAQALFAGADPAWSPDGTQVAYVRGFREDVYVRNADGSGAEVQLTTDAGRDIQPAWSPDGRWLVFASAMNRAITGGLDLWAIDLSTNALTRLTNNLGGDFMTWQPAWSPDGKTIVFAADDELWSIPAPGSGAAVSYPLVLPIADPSLPPDPNVTLLAQTCASVAPCDFKAYASPSWSPDGKKIAFLANASSIHPSSAGWEVHVMDANGQNGRFLAANAAHPLAIDPTGRGTEGPAWSPDGKQVAYTARGADGANLWLVDAALATATQLTFAPGDEHSPDWQSLNVALGNTPQGANVVVSLGDVTIRFANVTAAGDTTVVSSTSGPPPPAGFEVVGVYYELATTAQFDSAEVCFAYQGSPAPSIVHYVNGQPVVLTTRDTGQAVCADVTSFSPFALVRPLADGEPPTLSLPGNVVVNATSPAGAVVTYAASATDDVDPSPTVGCSPASGSTFPIGMTTVACTASDASGNEATGTFIVTVKGAKEQLADLIQKVVNASQLSAAAKTLLLGRLNQLLASFDPSNASQRQAVCLALQIFKTAVQLQAGKTITQAQAAEWIADANRIRAVLGC